jgi:ABC-type sugar transport system permease subunit
VFLPMAIAATALAIIWNFVYARRTQHRAAERDPRPVHVAGISWLGNPVARERALIAAGDLGLGRVRDGHPVGRPQEHPERGAGGRARTTVRTNAQIFFRIILPMVSLPISVLAVTLPSTSSSCST